MSVDLNVKETGAGRTLIWGHGLSASMQLEDEARVPDWSRWSGEFRLVRYDARSHGESGCLHTPEECRWDKLGEDMLDLAEQVCEDAALVFGGMSMGAATALHLACAAPERVAALVLVLPPTAWETRVRQVRIYRVMARVVKLLGPRALKALLGLSKQPELPWTRGRMHKAMAAAVGRVSIPHLVNALKGAALSDLPSQEAVSELTMPTLILAWENDFTHPLSSAHRLQELMPHAELKIARSDEEVEHWVDDIQAFMRANLG